jgi:hypothetical protein
MYLQKLIGKQIKLFFVGILLGTRESLTKRAGFRICKLSVRIQGSGSVQKCHGSGTPDRMFSTLFLIFSEPVLTISISDVGI